MKYSFKFKTSDKYKQNLLKVFKTIYKYAEGRKIEKYFEINIENANIKLFLEKLSYIISFTLLCLSPGELLEYEYKEDYENIINDINIEKKNILNKEKNLIINDLDKEFNSYFDNYNEDNILDKDIIYYKEKLYIHNENDDFSKYEKQIKENDIKVEQKIEEENNEFSKSCYSEITNIINYITENKIDISNLLLFLENCHKFFMKIPFILSKKENEAQLNDYFSGVQMIIDYINELKKMDIMKTKFGDIIENYFNQFDSLNSKFNNNKNNSIHKDDDNYFEYTKKCELPFDTRLEKGQYNNMENSYVNKRFVDNKYLIKKTNIEHLESETSKMDKYENKKDLNFKEKTDDKYKIINKIQELSEEDKKSMSIEITMEGIMEDIEVKKDLENNENEKKVVLKNDLTDFKEEIFEVKDIRQLYEDKNISTTIILKDIMKIVNHENQKYSLIRDINDIKDLKINFDDSLTFTNSEFYDAYSKSSFLLQNIISNLIREKLLIYNEEKILPYSLLNSYMDILIDISQTMSEEQKIASLLITTGLSISFSKYGIKIRISVFGERDNVWLLSDDFSSENIQIQLSRLRESLACLKKIQSFPGDVLKILKNSFYKKYDNKNIVKF